MQQDFFFPHVFSDILLQLSLQNANKRRHELIKCAA